MLQFVLFLKQFATLYFIHSFWPIPIFNLYIFIFILEKYQRLSKEILQLKVEKDSVLEVIVQKNNIMLVCA